MFCFYKEEKFYKFLCIIILYMTMASYNCQCPDISTTSIEYKDLDATKLQRNLPIYSEPVIQQYLEYGVQLGMSDKPAPQNHIETPSESSSKYDHLISPDLITQHLIASDLETQHYHETSTELVSHYQNPVATDVTTHQVAFLGPATQYHHGISAEKTIHYQNIIDPDPLTYAINTEYNTYGNMLAGSVAEFDLERSTDKSLKNRYADCVHPDIQKQHQNSANIETECFQTTDRSLTNLSLQSSFDSPIKYHHELCSNSVEQNNCKLFDDPAIKQYNHTYAEEEFQNHNFYVNPDFKRSQNYTNSGVELQISNEQRNIHHTQLQLNVDWQYSSKVHKNTEVQQYAQTIHGTPNPQPLQNSQMHPIPEHLLDVSKKQEFLINKLKSHLFISAEEKLHFCVICKKGFKYKHSLKRHLSIHTREKEYACSICQKRYKYEHFLKRHMSVHTREKEYAAYVRKDSLKNPI